jgi:hypothetical protein
MLWLVAAVGCGGDLGLPSSSGEGLDLSIVGGNGQTGTVGEALAEPLVVEVVSSGRPIDGHRIAFVTTGDPAAGRLEPDTAETGEDGRAVAYWVLGHDPGAQEVQARLVVTEPTPPPTAVFEASALAGAADSVRAVSALNQPGRIGRPTTEDPTVVVVDRFGNPVTGAGVEWTVTSGDGSVSSPSTTTGEDGSSSVVWTLGIGVGAQKLTARVGGVHGSPVTFRATVLF